jgi:hypothetical protein
MKKLLMFLIALCFLGVAQAANIVTPIVPPVKPTPIYQPSGPSGSRTNPIKISKPTGKIASGYIPSTSPENGRGAVKVPAGQKTYFEVDPLATTGRSVIGFGLSVKFYSGMGAVCNLTQDKATLAYSSETCQGYTSFSHAVYDNQPYEVDNIRFLYAIDNSFGVADVSNEIWATIP